MAAGAAAGKGRKPAAETARAVVSTGTKRSGEICHASLAASCVKDISAPPSLRAGSGRHDDGGNAPTPHRTDRSGGPGSRAAPSPRPPPACGRGRGRAAEAVISTGAAMPSGRCCKRAPTFRAARAGPPVRRACSARCRSRSRPRVRTCRNPRWRRGRACRRSPGSARSSPACCGRTGSRIDMFNCR